MEVKDEAVRALLMKLVGSAGGPELTWCEPCFASSVRRVATHRRVYQYGLDTDPLLCSRCAVEWGRKGTVVPLEYGPELERVLSFYPLPEDPKAYDVP
jgi:hypothetical protein